MQCYNHDKISWDTFWCFADFKLEKCSLSSPTPSMQCCATVAACKKQQNFCVWQTWQGYNLRDCCDPHLTLLCSGPLRKYLFKGRWSLAENYFKQNFCHACHTRFAVLLCSTILLHIQKFTIVWFYKECTSKYAVKVLGQQKSRNTVGLHMLLICSLRDIVQKQQTCFFQLQCTRQDKVPNVR